MHITPEEARSSLADIKEADARMRRALESDGAKGILWTWGAVWFIGYLATYLLTEGGALGWIGPIWLALNIAGMVSTVGICMHSPIDSPNGRKIGALWWTLAAYGWIWASFARPTDPYSFNAWLSTVIMFAWVLVGVIAEVRLWIYIGMLATALICAGYWWLAPSPSFWLWMAFGLGGLMLACGTLVHVKGGRRG